MGSRMKRAAGNYAADLNNPGWILGWGIVNDGSITLRALFPNEADAFAALDVYGPGHSVKRVSNKSGSDDFMIE